MLFSSLPITFIVYGALLWLVFSVAFYVLVKRLEKKHAAELEEAGHGEGNE